MRRRALTWRAWWPTSART